MNKIESSISGLVTLFLVTIAFISCSTEENTQNPVSASNESLSLKKVYGFESISFKNDKSNNSMFNSSTNFNKLTSDKSSQNQDLDLKNVTQINWKNAKISFLIPFKNNSRKSLVITIETNKIGSPLNLEDADIVENIVDSSNGNGNIIITNSYGSTKKIFEKGSLKKQKNIYGKVSPFRKCFDDAYDAICDGFIGCASWYSSPLPALTAVAYCGATT